MSELEEIVRTTCPRDCYDTCGVAVHKRNGAIESVRGDPGHFVSQGQLCPKCSIGYNNEWLDPRTRLTRPLRRVGRKGEGRFEPVSWDVALGSIADRLKRIIASAGPQAILNTHYSGTISLIGYLFPTRFFNRLGATEVSPVGAHAFVATFAVVLQDVPPFTTVSGYPAKPHGTNNEGLRRRGFTADDILEVRRAYKALYRENLTLDEARAKIGAAAAHTPALQPLVDFLAVPGRGIVR